MNERNLECTSDIRFRIRSAVPPGEGITLLPDPDTDLGDAKPAGSQWNAIDLA
jgi:hypothetical protein